jgi:peptide deformylase
MGTGDEYVAYFNPKLISTEDEVHMEEGCLSVPYLMLNITRPKMITVEYQDYNGTNRNATFDGMTARCFLHELDHMNGIMYTDKVKPLALQFGIKKMQKMHQKISKQMRMITQMKTKK